MQIASRFSSAFASIVASNMALDASDKGFEQALEQSLPSIEETPLMTASLEGVFLLRLLCSLSADPALLHRSGK